MSLDETGRKPRSQRDERDILAMATRALREQCDGGDRRGERGERDGRRDSSHGPRTNPAATRSRVMMSLRQQERRRTAAIYVLLPAAAVLVASTAWATASGRLPDVVKSLGQKLGLVETASSSMPAPPSVPAVPAAGTPSGSATTDAPARPVPPTEAPPAEVAPPEAHHVTEPAEPPRALAPASQAVTPAPPALAHSAPAKAHPFDERGDKLYEAAHRAHFEDRNWSAALTAWDRYLAASPGGRFAPEARYNRAIVLLRLDRRDEAVRELTPFADGKYGGYRQEEARGLIEAVGK